MKKPPVTSTTLLRVIGANSQSARWVEFIEKYESFMIASVRKKCPTINDNDMEDVLQDIMIVIMKLLPNYRYAPEEKGKGHFHNYLYGICKNVAGTFETKCSRFCNRVELRSDIETLTTRDGENVLAPDVEQWFVEKWRNDKTDEEHREYEKWRKSALEVALQQLMADPKIQQQTKEIFRLVAVDGEKTPDEIAKMFNLTRNNVDQIKNRMMDKLRKLAFRLTHLDAAEGGM